MAVTSVNRNPMTSQLLQMRTQLEDLQRQLGTGKKSESYAGLGYERSVSVSFRQRVTDIDNYASNVDETNLRIKLLDSSLTRLNKVPSDVRAALDPNAYQVRLDGRTDAQKTARIALDEVVGLLNAEADGRYLFAGKATQTKPVVPISTMLDGEGAKKGLKHVIAERLQADQGLAGSHGRLTTSAAGATATLARQVPLSSEFGFQIAEAETSNETAIQLTKSGDPAESVGVTFTAQPNAGDSVTLHLTLPDRTMTTVTLTATVADPAGEGGFTIGADETETAENFSAALDVMLDRKAKSDLKAASAVRASEMFFDTGGGKMPKRVDAGGGSLATATELRDASETDTVVWYRGHNAEIDPDDPATLPRSDNIARVDSSIDVSYGVRANEDAFRVMVQSLAVTSLETFDPAVQTDEDRYRALIERTRDALSFTQGRQSPQDVHSEIAVAGNVAKDAAERHKVNKTAVLEMLDGVEGIKAEDLAAQILTLQTRMNASYQTTSMLSQLTLLNYM